jgi:hypothetical protein
LFGDVCGAWWALKRVKRHLACHAKSGEITWRACEDDTLKGSIISRSICVQSNYFATVKTFLQNIYTYAFFISKKDNHIAAQAVCTRISSGSLDYT